MNIKRRHTTSKLKVTKQKKMRIIKLCHAVIGLVGMIFGTTNAKKASEYWQVKLYLNRSNKNF